MWFYVRNTKLEFGEMMVFNDSLYDTTGVCRHVLTVDLINKKQILFVPVLQTKVISETATIYDYPMDSEEIGAI